jgi:type VI secretion system Hcp family effector
MSSLIYVSINGSAQGNISAGCCSVDSIGNRGQLSHNDQILVHCLNHSLTREQNVNHHPLVFQKPIDKSSPLLAVAASNNEKLSLEYYIYRTNQNGSQELYFKIKLTEATISDISTCFPHSVEYNDADPYETISVKYASITWSHIIAGTSGYSIWDDRVY